MPAPTALLKQVDNTPSSNTPLPEVDQDEDFALEGMNDLPEDANAVLQPERMATGDHEMEIDEEDKPHFAPVQNTVCNASPPHSLPPHTLKMRMCVYSMPTSTPHRTQQPTSSRAK